MKVYIVEDHESMRFILKRLLKKNFPSIMAVGESETAENALQQIPSFCPDLVLVDISLPGMDGIELIRKLKPQCKMIYILVVTGHEVDIYKQSALEAGADDIVSKYDDKQILNSIHTLFKKQKLHGSE